MAEERRHVSCVWEGRGSNPRRSGQSVFGPTFAFTNYAMGWYIYIYLCIITIATVIIITIIFTFIIIIIIIIIIITIQQQQL